MVCGGGCCGSSCGSCSSSCGRNSSCQGCGDHGPHCGYGPRTTCIPVAKCGPDCGPGCGICAPWYHAGEYCGQGKCALNCGSGCGPGCGPSCGPLCGPMCRSRPRVYISGPKLYRDSPLPPAIGKACWARTGPKRYCNTICLKKIISHIDLNEPHRTIPFDPAGPYFCCK